MEYLSELNLSKYQIRTDLVVDLTPEDFEFEKKYEYKDVLVSNISINEEPFNRLT